MKKEILDYAKGLNASNTILVWIESINLDNKDQGEIEHIIDFLIYKNFTSLSWASYALLKEKSNKWIKMLSQNVATIDEEYGKDLEIILDFENGFKFVKLVSESSYRREGALMSHCVASYYNREVEIFSLRDEFNKPHCTIEKDVQIKGKGNGSIHPKYIDYVVKFLEWSGMEVRDSEMKNLGYKRVSFYKYCVNTSLYREKYIRENEEIKYSANVLVLDSINEVQEYKGNKIVLLKGDIFLKEVAIPKGFQMPQECGYIYLRGSTIPEGFQMPQKCGYINLRNTIIPKGFQMPQECGNINLRNTIIPKGFQMPQECGYINLRNTIIPKGFQMPQKCGNIYLEGSTIPEGFQIPQKCGHINYT